MDAESTKPWHKRITAVRRIKTKPAGVRLTKAIHTTNINDNNDY